MSSVALDMGEKYQDGQYNEQQSLIREQPPGELPPSYKVSSSRPEVDRKCNMVKAESTDGRPFLVT